MTRRYPIHPNTPLVCCGVPCTWATFLFAQADLLQLGDARTIRVALETHGAFTGGLPGLTWTVQIQEAS